MNQHVQNNHFVATNYCEIIQILKFNDKKFAHMYNIHNVSYHKCGRYEISCTTRAMWRINDSIWMEMVVVANTTKIRCSIEAEELAKKINS